MTMDSTLVMYVTRAIKVKLSHTVNNHVPLYGTLTHTDATLSNKTKIRV